MDQNQLEKIVNYIIDQGVQAIKDNTDETSFVIDYLAIFAKDESEYQDLLQFTQGLGNEIDLAKIKTGLTFLLNKPIETKAGPLKQLKIRKPDPTRPQRGAPDFKIDNYSEFKEKYLQKSGNFTLMVKSDFEMVELKGVDVLVYFPNKLSTERIST